MKVNDIVYYIHRTGNKTQRNHSAVMSMIANSEERIPLIIEQFNSSGSARCRRQDGTGTLFTYDTDDLVFASKDESFLSSLYKGG